MSELLALIAEGFGLGRIPMLGAIAATGLGLALAWWNAARPPAVQVAVAAVLTAAAMPICHAAWLTARADAAAIVADEVLTMPVAAIAWTAGRRLWAIPLAVAATGILDWLKPFPADWAETLPGAAGIVFDDLVAAGYVLAAGTAITLVLGRRRHPPGP